MTHKTPEQSAKGKSVWGAFGFKPTPKMSELESFSPTDDRFCEATSSSEQVFPISENERASLKTLEDRTEVVFEKGDYEEAQRLADGAKVLKLELDAKELAFRLVYECEVDSRLCVNMEKQAKDYLKAGEWHEINKVCAARLHDAEEQKKQKERKGKRAKTVRRRAVACVIY
jgi:hypothetical protein